MGIVAGGAHGGIWDAVSLAPFLDARGISRSESGNTSTNEAAEKA
jgi:hypothetical protein